MTYTLSGADASKYTAPAPTVITNGEITKKELSISDLNITTSKVYDGTNSVSTVPKAQLTGVAPGDEVIVDATAIYDNAAAGTGKTITVAYTLSGADASKYTSPAPTVLTTGEIKKKVLMITAPTVANKEYDGTNTAAVTPGILSGIVGSDEVSVDRAVGVFNDANVGTNKAVTVSYVLSGAQAGNYTLVNSSAQANIRTKVISVPTPVIESATGKMTVTLSDAIVGLTAGDIFVVKDGDQLRSGTDYTVAINGTNVEITFTAAAKLKNNQVLILGVAVYKQQYEINGGELIQITNNIPSIIPPDASLWTSINWGGEIVSYKYGDTLYVTTRNDLYGGAINHFQANDNSEKLSSDGITKVVILEGVTHIGDFAFINNQLTSVTIPDGVRSIGAGAFGYNQLTSVTLPAGINTIGDIAFGNNKLQSVTFEGWVYTISSSAFHGNGKNQNVFAEIHAAQIPGTFKLDETAKQWIKQ